MGVVGHGFVDHIPGIDHILVPVYHLMDMTAHALEQQLLGGQLTIVVEHPFSYLIVPHQTMTTHLDALTTAEVGYAVGPLPTEHALLRLCRLRLHVVLGSDTVELLKDKCHLTGCFHVALVHRNAHSETVLIGILQSFLLLGHHTP